MELGSISRYISVTDWNDREVLIAGNYENGTYVWYEGNKTTPIKEFFWSGGDTPVFPGYMLATQYGWTTESYKKVFYYVCEW